MGTTDTLQVRLSTASAVLRTILTSGPISRTEVAQVTGLSKQTISDVVRELCLDGWISEFGRTDGRPGRSAITYAINRKKSFAASIHLGGSKIIAAITDLLGTVLAELSAPTDPRGGVHLVDQFIEMLETLTGEAGISLGDLFVIVLGTPGVLDPGTGHIDAAPNVPGIDSMDIRGALSKRLNASVLIENDVNLAALGEHWKGHGRGKDNFAFVALGTGIGMGIIGNGALLRGKRGASGEIAYLPVGSDPFDPRNFSKGALESSVGAGPILQRYRTLGGDNSASISDVFGAFQREESAAIITLQEVARHVCLGISAVVAVLDPEVIILGGTIGVRPELVALIRDYLPRCTPFSPAVEVSQFGSRASLIGGLSMAVNTMQRELLGLGL